MINDSVLNIATFNCKNVQTCSPAISELSKTTDIILLQEHWLFKCQLHLLNEVNDQYIGSGKSVDMNDPIAPVQMPRGYGGVAILWNKNINHLVTDLDLGNERIKCIEIEAQKPILIMCVYMPCRGSKDNYLDFQDCIAQIHEIIQTFQHTHRILIGGDLNESALTIADNRRSRCLHQFLRENELVTWETDCTFIHPNGKDSSTIDFFLATDRVKQVVNSVKRVDDCISNVSDHYPVSLEMQVNLANKSPMKTIATNSRLNWKKIDTKQYQSTVEENLSRIDLPYEDVDQLIISLNSVMADSSKSCHLITNGRRKRPKLKVMNTEIANAIKAKKVAFYNWKINGRPNYVTSELLLKKKETTVNLRREIRLEVAKNRNKDKETIMHSRQQDNALFHRLINKQRGKSRMFIEDLYVGNELYSNDNILDGWHQHFKSLATREDYTGYDTDYLNMTAREVHTIQRICTDTAHQPVTINEVETACKSLNRGKAQDVYGISAEHLFYGGATLLRTVQTVINAILSTNSVPDCMKLGTLNPIFKNKGSVKQSGNYRGITITPTITRLLETILKNRIEHILQNELNPLQRGFTKNSSPMNCALMIEELIRHNTDINKPTYIAFMDGKSAFDVVVHSSLMRKLYHMGVNGNNWTIINSLHQGARTAVKWRNKLSDPYINQQGVRQGGVLSADLYKVYINELLDRLSNTGIGATIGNITVPAPTCADDVTLISSDPNELQRLINITKDYSFMEGYQLQEVKSVILRVKTSKREYNDNESWTLGDKHMPIVDSTTHMGILRTTKSQEHHAVEDNIQKAKRTLYSLMGSGLHGENGLDPETSTSLIQTYVLPVLTYGLEVIIPTGKSLTMLEVQFKKIIKHVLSMSTHTADPAVYMLSGFLPIEACIHKKILSLFGNITRSPNTSIEKQLAERQLEVKSMNSNSWFIAVKKILLKYDLQSPDELIQMPPKKQEWKRIINKAVNEKWTQCIVNQAELYSSLNQLSKVFIPGRCHPAIIPYQNSYRDVNRIPIKVKILTGTYILQTNRVKFNQNEVNKTCLLCHEADEDLQHFLLDCKELRELRDPIMTDIVKILNILNDECPSVTKYSLLQLIVDCNILHTDTECGNTKSYMELLQYNSRRLCYTLHGLRYRKLELLPKRPGRNRTIQHT
ncbi:MAG: reverse transcriptase domain-containing protein [Sedimenticola sp.]